MSGTCFNCLSNAMGTSCEDCVEGYDRELPYSFIPCNICASGYYDLGNSTCVGECFVVFVVVVVCVHVCCLNIEFG